MLKRGGEEEGSYEGFLVMLSFPCEEKLMKADNNVFVCVDLYTWKSGSLRLCTYSTDKVRGCLVCMRRGQRWYVSPPLFADWSERGAVVTSLLCQALPLVYRASSQTFISQANLIRKRQL